MMTSQSLDVCPPMASLADLVVRESIGFDVGEGQGTGSKEFLSFAEVGLDQVAAHVYGNDAESGCGVCLGNVSRLSVRNYESI